MCVARAPEERAPRLPERVERTHEREIPEGLLLQANACRELIERLECPAALALLDNRLSFLLAQSFDGSEADPHVVRTAFPMRGDSARRIHWVRGRGGSRAQWDPRPYVVEGGTREHGSPLGRVTLRSGLADRLRKRSIHIDGQDRDSVAFRISGDDCGRVEAHGLVVEESDVELGGVVELQMSGVIRGERECRGVALTESELGEGRDLAEDLVRGDVVDALLARPADERPAQLLHVGARARAAHRATEHGRGRWRESRGRDRDAEDLLLEEDHAERLLEDRLEQRMRVLHRLAALPAGGAGIYHVPLRRAWPDARDLDDDVREVPRPHARQGLRLRTALHLEETDRVDLADEVVHGGVVER